MPASEPSRQQLSELIGAIYDCAIQPQRWGATLDTLCDVTQCINAAMAVQSLPAGRILLFHTSTIEPSLLESMGRYGAEVVDQWGGIEAVMNFPLEEPSVLSWTRPRHLWENNRYYAEWAKPQGIIDVLGFLATRDAHAFGTVGLARHQSAGPVTSREVDILRLLMPHLQRTISISRLLDIRTVEARTFEATLDAVAAGIILVDAGRRVVHANKVADAMLSTGDPVGLERGILTLRSAPAHEALAAAVRGASDDETGIGRKGLGIPTRRANGDPAVLYVLPLKKGTVRAGLTPSASAAVFVASETTSPPSPDQALAALFDLTPAEARVFSLIAAGKNVEHVAELLDISQSTVKTHLLRLFTKTGTRRQPELVKLAASLTLLGRE